jgi:hypothetical protein
VDVLIKRSWSGSCGNNGLKNMIKKKREKKKKNKSAGTWGTWTSGNMTSSSSHRVARTPSWEG